MAGRQFFRNEGRPAFQPETGFFDVIGEGRSRNGGNACLTLVRQKNKAGKTPSGLAGLIQFKSPASALLQRSVRTENMKPKVHVPLMGKRLDMQIVRVVDVFADL